MLDAALVAAADVLCDLGAVLAHPAGLLGPASGEQEQEQEEIIRGKEEAFCCMVGVGVKN